VLVSQWKKKLLERAAEAFSTEATSHDSERVHDELLKKIGELTVERDLWARGLRRSRWRRNGCSCSQTTPTSRFADSAS
jgi:hypothetical protein